MKRHVTIWRGFSLVEMLVAVAIFAVISSILLANYPEFRSRAALDNTAHEVALVFREAQVYGISVRGAGNSFPVYGVHFNPDTPTKIIIFTDTKSDKMYTPLDDQLLDTFTLTGGESITQACENGTFTGGVLTGCPTTAKLYNVIFERPNPDALFYDQTGTIITEPYLSFEVSNRSRSYRRAVQITSTGQIVVK